MQTLAVGISRAREPAVDAGLDQQLVSGDRVVVGVAQAGRVGCLGAVVADDDCEARERRVGRALVGGERRACLRQDHQQREGHRARQAHAKTVSARPGSHRVAPTGSTSLSIVC